MRELFPQPLRANLYAYCLLRPPELVSGSARAQYLIQAAQNPADLHSLAKRISSTKLPFSLSLYV
jgi:hypothetical protein